MLINKQLETGKFMSLHLTSGDEVIGEIKEVADDYIILNTPYKVKLTQSGPAYFPFSFCVEQNTRSDTYVTVYMSSIMAVHECAQDIEAEYRRLRTGIETVTADRHIVMPQ